MTVETAIFAQQNIKNSHLRLITLEILKMLNVPNCFIGQMHSINSATNHSQKALSRNN